MVKFVLKLVVKCGKICDEIEEEKSWIGIKIGMVVDIEQGGQWPLQF